MFKYDHTTDINHFVCLFLNVDGWIDVMVNYRNVTKKTKQKYRKWDDFLGYYLDKSISEVTNGIFSCNWSKRNSSLIGNLATSINSQYSNCKDATEAMSLILFIDSSLWLFITAIRWWCSCCLVIAKRSLSSMLYSMLRFLSSCENPIFW